MPKRFLFLDLETSGLEVSEHYILEVACIAVDDDFQEATPLPVSRFHMLVPLDMQVIQQHMNDFARTTHAGNGLLHALEALTPKPFVVIDAYEYVEGMLIRFLESRGYEKGGVILCGHSIHFDRAFILEDMPRVGEWLSHRMLDIGAIGRFLREQCGIDVGEAPKMPHRALGDVSLELEEAQKIRRMLRSMWSIITENAVNVSAPGL
jgi:oligoribonuclease